MFHSVRIRYNWPRNNEENTLRIRLLRKYFERNGNEETIEKKNKTEQETAAKKCVGNELRIRVLPSTYKKPEE